MGGGQRWNRPKIVKIKKLVAQELFILQLHIIHELGSCSMWGARGFFRRQLRHRVACLIFGPGPAEGQAHKGFGGSYYTYPLSERPRKVSPCGARTYPAVIIEPWFGTWAGSLRLRIGVQDAAHTIPHTDLAEVS